MRAWSADSRRDQLQRRLAAVTSGWVPTPESVEAELADISAAPGGDGVAPPQRPVAWADADPSAASPPRIGRQALPAVVFVAVGAIVGATVLWLLAWPRGVAVPPTTGAGWASSPTGASAPAVLPTGVATASAAATGTVVVDVAGAVRRPGVFELPAGSRVVDALESAGGAKPRADTTSLNLARVLADGEQVLVPLRGTTPGVVAPPATGTTTAPAQLDLNTATLEQLDTLPGIGPVLAQRILDWRTLNGGFVSVDQLQEVSGIGEATYADLAPLVRV